MNYLHAPSLDEALAALGRHPRRVICGGTDAYADPSGRASADGWLDISRLAELRGIEVRDGMLRIGAATTWDEIDRAPQQPAALGLHDSLHGSLHDSPPDSLPNSLREAARQIGSRQIRVAGSIGGNLCHAAPAADGVPPLLTLDARVELASTRGVRQLPLDQFLLGRRRTALQADELLTAVLIPALVPALAPAPVPARVPAHVPSHVATERTAFIKCANRDGTALAVVSAAVRLRWNDSGVLSRAHIAIGSASEVPVRLRGLEMVLEGARPESLSRLIRETPNPELSPIDDVRGSASLRRHLARIAVERACARCAKEAIDV
jgi:CO/xanthine dehydrogenase FAD-binding subunit